jgi:hypothetical protein
MGDLPGLKVVAAAAAAALALFHLANLSGAGYEAFAARQLDRPQSPATLAAARIASRWTPWSARRLGLHGWVLAENGDDRADLTYRRALRVAPGDPLLWTEYAQALARLGRFEAAMTTALRQAWTRAPTSNPVRGSLADIGLSYWSRGTPDQQAVWLDAMRAELTRDRGAFLGQAMTRGQGRAFCGDVAPRLDERAWCASMAPALADGCYDLTPAGPVPCAPNR